VETYRRLLKFLRPHRLRLVGNIVANVIAAALDAVAFTLLIPFLSTLFDQAPLDISNHTLKAVLDFLVGRVIGPDKAASLLGIIVVMVAMVTLKNLFI